MTCECKKHETCKYYGNTRIWSCKNKTSFEQRQVNEDYCNLYEPAKLSEYPGVATGSVEEMAKLGIHVEVKELREKIKDAKIVAIYLKVDERERLYRMLTKRDPKSATERIVHDREAFKIVPCDFALDANRKIEEVLKDVKSIIDSI